MCSELVLKCSDESIVAWERIVAFLQAVFSATFQGSVNFYPAAKKEICHKYPELILILKRKLNHSRSIQYKSAPNT
jgi:hypothetical protein